MIKIRVVKIEKLVLLRVELYAPAHSLVKAFPSNLLCAWNIIDGLSCKSGFLFFLANEFEFDFTWQLKEFESKSTITSDER